MSRAIITSDAWPCSASLWYCSLGLGAFGEAGTAGGIPSLTRTSPITPHPSIGEGVWQSTRALGFTGHEDLSYGMSKD